MATFAKRFKELRLDKTLTQEKLAQMFFLNKSSISRYESGKQIPEPSLLQNFADFFAVSLDYLMGKTDQKHINEFNPNLTKRDEKDIAKKLEEIINAINTHEDLTIDNNHLDGDTKELLIASIERTLRQAKLSAKEKFTPNKYK